MKIDLLQSSGISPLFYISLIMSVFLTMTKSFKTANISITIQSYLILFNMVNADFNISAPSTLSVVLLRLLLSPNY